MTQYILVTRDEDSEPIELPSENDGTLLLSTLSAQFPGACGLKFRNPITCGFRALRLCDEHLYPPEEGWESHIFLTVFSKDNKRKSDDDEVDDCAIKTKRLERKCQDLIVLGLPWKSTEDDLHKYFSQFGELLKVQVRKDLKTGLSKGFGFVRFQDYESQLKCLNLRHRIDGRWCDVRIPNSKGGNQQQMNSKVFVGRCTEDMTENDLHEYFSQFGEVIDVLIPKPFRAFAFVTFSDPDVAKSLCGEDHIVKNVSVHVSNALPVDKHKNNWDRRYQSQGNFGYGQGSWKYGNRSDTGNMNGPSMNLGNFPAVLAAAQAVLSSSGGWGSFGMGQGGNCSRDSNNLGSSHNYRNGSNSSHGWDGPSENGYGHLHRSGYNSKSGGGWN